MRHAKSNINVLKKPANLKAQKPSDFILRSTLNKHLFKSPTQRNQFFILSLLDQKHPKTKKNTSTNFSLNNNTNTNASSANSTFRNQIFSFHSKYDKPAFNSTNCSNRGSLSNSNQINIRLNLNSEIINNNYVSTKKKKSENQIDMLIRDKDDQIERLQKELLLAKKLVKSLQKEHNENEMRTSSTILTNTNYNHCSNFNTNIIADDEINNWSKGDGLKENKNFMLTLNKHLNMKSPKIKQILSPKNLSSKIIGYNFDTFSYSTSNSPSHSINNLKNYKRNKTVKLSNNQSEYSEKNNKMSISSTKVNNDYQITNFDSLVQQCTLLKKRAKRVLDKYFKAVTVLKQES